MHPGHHDHPLYTGTWPHRGLPAMGPFMHPHAQLHGFCHSCCHPMVKCCCHIRECRKEAKELLVAATTPMKQAQANAQFRSAAQHVASVPHFATVFRQATEAEGATAEAQRTAERGSMNRAEMVTVTPAAAAAPTNMAGAGTAFIGGGCCVHLSAEYAPSTPTATCAVAVIVADSEGTMMMWIRVEKPGVGYQVKEAIISTKPGAHLTVIVLNGTVRVRWCEIFSC